MTIKVENIGVIERAVKERLGKLRPAFKQAVGLERERIKTRTQSGLDVNGNPFRYYVPRTVIARQAEKKQVAHVDLTFHGDMFRALKANFSETEWTVKGVITFGSQSWKVLKNESYARKFFGLSNEQVEIIKTKLRNAK